MGGHSRFGPPVSARGFGPPQSKSANGYGPPFADLDPQSISASGFGAPRSKSASGYVPPLAELDPRYRIWTPTSPRWSISDSGGPNLPRGVHTRSISASGFGAPRSKSASRYVPPLAELDPRYRIWTPTSPSPNLLADMDPLRRFAPPTRLSF